MPKQPSKADSKPLNVRQERFCELVVSGVPANQAYLKAGYEATEQVAESLGPRLNRNERVKARITEMRAKMAERSEFKRQDLVDWLVEAIVTPPSQLTPDSRVASEVWGEQIGGGSKGKLKRGKAPSGNELIGAAMERIRVKGVGKMEAARLLTEMMGWKEPEQIVVETGPKTLEMLEQRAKAVESMLVRKLTPLPSGERMSPREAVAASGRN